VSIETSIRVLVANGPRLFRELVISTLSKHAGVEIVGEAKDKKDVPSLVAETKPNVLLIAMDESRRRPSMCDELLRKFRGLRIIALGPNTNLGTLYRVSLKIHSTTMGTSKDVLLKVMRDSVSRMEEEQLHERNLIPTAR
jgi:DNA-binding NarL/FixJ family response regulator